VFDGLFAAAIVVPGVVIGIATLVALVEVFGFLNPLLAAVWPGEQPPQTWRLDTARSSRPTACFHHGAGDDDRQSAHCQPRPRYRRGLQRSLRYAFTTFREIVLPQILPSVLAGFLLAFTFSFDDFIIAFFVAGSNTTLPIYVFASIRRGVTPEINAIATMVLIASLVMILIARFLMREKQQKTPRETP
jgi:spermidine/putrescine transport system permease protein